MEVGCCTMSRHFYPLFVNKLSPWGGNTSSIFSHCLRQKSDVTSNMGRKAYWESFYKTRRMKDPSSQTNFDWFFSYAAVKDIFNAAIVSTSPASTPGTPALIAELGCGTSELAHQLVSDHPDSCHITCLDFSMNALEHSKTAAENELASNSNASTNLDYIASDVCHLPFKEDSFDIVFEKGTMDAMLKTGSTRMKSERLVSEALRVLKPSGVFLQFSDEPPELRLDLLLEINRNLRNAKGMQFSTSYKCISQDEGIEYFVYTIQNKDFEVRL